MTRRTLTPDERREFEAAFAEARPVVPKNVDRSQRKQESVAKSISTGGLDGRTAERLRRGLLEPHGKLDLHGYTEAAAHRALLAFLRSARAHGHRLVLVVTGRGAKADFRASPRDSSLTRRGVLKSAVPRWLNEPEFAALIAGCGAAHRRHGGDGALYIYLRKNAA
jgi:DNA-nicking Smr family endonuclease